MSLGLATRGYYGSSSSSVVPAIPVVLPLSDLRIADRSAGDLGLLWSLAAGDADLTVVDSDVAADRGLRTSVLLSLFLDRRAEDDDVSPSGDPRDRRGSWTDQFEEIKGDRIGSRLWLLDRSVDTKETALRAEEYVREALAWMIEDRVVASIDVTITIPDRVIEIGLQRPGRDPVSFRFAHAWNHEQEDA